MTFKSVNIFFACILGPLVAFDILYDLPHPLIIFPGLVLAYFCIVFYGCYVISSGFFMKVICSATTDKKQIAISFDDGPLHSYTPQILSTLKDNNVKAGFFCIGKHIAGNEPILRQIKEDDHLIGNHSFSHHFFFDLFSSGRMLNEMKLTDQETRKVIGFTPKLFRPPYGVINPGLRKAIVDGGYTPVGWSVRSMDTVIKDQRKLFNKIVKALKPGAVYLFHDSSAATVAILPDFIKHVKLHGYEIVRLDKMLNLKPYA